MEAKLMESRKLELGSGNTYCIDYYLLVNEVKLQSGSLLCENYGIKAVINEQSGSISGESAEIPDITPSMEKITKLIKKVADNLVTPVALKYVVEDFIAY